MGAILKVKKFTTLREVVIVAVGLAIVLGGVYWFAPGLRVDKSKQLAGLELDGDNINNSIKGEMLALPTNEPSSVVSDKGLIRIAEYAWNGNSGMIVANGGPRTTKGSLMETGGVNLEIIRQDMVGGLRDMQLKFIEEFNSGVEYPKSDKSAFAVSIMGDGVPFYITTTQKAIDEKFGKGKYHVQAIAPIGLSYGEDKVIGPQIWKDNPQTMKGAVISSVIGDGDWVLAVNFASVNAIPVNPDPSTYDAEALNFVPSQDDDYINSVKELIKSQKTGFTVPLKEVVNGKLTGKTINHKIDGATTWTPGDKMAFDELEGFTDVVSTKDFVNQMPTTIVVVKEWAIQHEALVTSMLKQTYIGCNQIKLYDQWAVRASEAVAETYNFETPKYWYDMFKGQKGSKGGVDFNVGGTRVFNLTDAKQYYGLKDGKNRYKSVYDQVSNYLTELNPCGFNESNSDGVIQFDDAINMYFLKNIADVDAGKVETISYTENKTQVMAEGNWSIQFETGSTSIYGSDDVLTKIYNLLIQAEESKLNVIGHTDNIGNSNSNLTLSKGRANSVVDYLVNKGISRNRFQIIDGLGSTKPVADNSTENGRRRNRRVEITLLK